MSEFEYKDGFEKRREQSKISIRQAAMSLFSQYGVEGVSMADIAKKAGVSQATIYNNFHNKQDLVREFVGTMVDALFFQAQQILSRPVSFEEKMMEIVGFISGAVAGGHPSEADALGTSIGYIFSDPVVQEIRETAKVQLTEMLVDLIREEEDSGNINPEISNQALAIYFNTYLDLFTNPGIQPQLATNPGLVEELTGLMVQGLK